MLEADILNYLKGKSACVTGGTGLIGRQVTSLLCDAGADVRVVSLDDIVVDERAEHVKADLTELSTCKDILQGMDLVFHLAGIKGSIDVTINKPASHFVPALMFNTNVLEASRLNKVEKLVYTSSIGAYSSAEVFVEGKNEDGPPMDFYAGWGKRMAEFQIQTYKIQYGMDNYSVVRPCNVYGPGDNFDPDNAMVIPTLMHRIRSGMDPVLVWGDGSAIRDFAFSRDVAIGTIQALYYGTGDSPYLNLGSGEGYSIRELVETLQEVVEFTPFFDTSKPSGFPRRVMDVSLSRERIHFNPQTSLKQGLQETWDWYMQNEDEYKHKQNYFVSE
ncbi:NAD-dependent epimerase/dehydratase family protein [uncultured Pseudodesulfovibrio sp.]|uniref:NAD-dependent epimerase/dehydratase family protein n=1 Tax=uncultured Pseudodesulfovibrio sp. TaxID=2035858 RepID=UPI0029C61BD8|nr:NAD-dependent epimerase/dehydratase family protein [uncultured Pseudodesulfovibrio sp.]